MPSSLYRQTRNDEKYALNRWPGGGEGDLSLLPEEYSFFVYSHQTGWLATRTWRWWKGNGRKSGTSVFAEEKMNTNDVRSRVIHVSIARNVMRTYTTNT